MARVIVGVTGGIAAYKACELVRLLVRAGDDVTPLLTPEAESFVSAKTFEALARKELPRALYPHLTSADLLVVAPTSANTLAKLAHGLADNVLTQTALAFEGPILLAPAMNPRMWAHQATQDNLRQLSARCELIGPEEGELAEGGSGLGRMTEPEQIAARIRSLLAKRQQLAGKRLLVSAGGTREPLDAVRFLGNRSSGRMGVALAAEARRRGAQVLLVAANLAVPAPGGVELLETPTAAELERVVLEQAEGADAVVMAAAVADYRPAAASEGKRPKNDGPWTVTLEPTTDVLGLLGQRSNGQVLVGFAADRGAAGLERARAKLRAKGADLFVFNDVSRADIGFDAPDNEVVLVGGSGERALAKASKESIAGEILDEIARLLAERNGGR